MKIKNLVDLNLLKLVKLVVQETGEMSLTNLNGEKIRCKRFAHSSLVRSGFDPVTKKPVNFRIHTTKMEDRRVKDDLRDHKIKFLSYLIHSIEAAIMHQFILGMREDPINYIINHLHDCVLMHPNYVHHFYALVKRIYSGPDLYNAVFASVFDHAKRTLSISSSEKVDRLAQEFKELCDEFEKTLQKGSPQNLYQPEK